MIVGEAKHDFWAPVEPTLHVDEARFEFGACGAEIYNFNRGVAVICEENVFWLQVAVDDLDSCQMEQPVEQLRSKLSQQVFVHPSESRLLDVLVQVHAEKFKHDDVVATKIEAVVHLDDAIFVRVFAKDTLQKFGLYAGIVCLLLLVFAYLDSDNASTILHVDATDDLAERPSINDLLDEVPIADLLSYMRIVKTVTIRNLAHALHADAPNCVDALVCGQFSHFKWCQLAFVLLESLHGSEALELDSCKFVIGWRAARRLLLSLHRSSCCVCGS